MAITRASLAICLILSLVTIGTADYYSPPVYKSPVHKPKLPPPVYTPPAYKPTLPPPVQKPTLSPPVYTKPTIPPPVYKPTLSPPVYTKPTVPHPVYKPTPSPPVYTKPTIPPPVYKPTLSPPVYTKPTIPPPVYTPPVYKPTLSPPVYTKPTIPPPVNTPPIYKKSPTYSPPPYESKPTYTPPSKPYVPETVKAVDGIILCKNAYETYPIQGAKVKIVCSKPQSYGTSKNEDVIYSDPTDSKGYFHVALTNIKDLTHCRVKLYTSPVETCKNPTNVNKGLTGVPLSTYGHRFYSDKNLKLFSVGPFYYTGPKAAPTTPKY